VKTDSLGRNLRDLIDIVTTTAERHVGVKSLTNGIGDTTTAHGELVFGMFALMDEYEAALIKERTQAGSRRRPGPRPPRRPQTQDYPQVGGQSPADVRLTPLHDRRDRAILRGQPDDDLPPHPHRSNDRTVISGPLSANGCTNPPRPQRPARVVAGTPRRCPKHPMQTVRVHARRTSLPHGS